MKARRLRALSYKIDSVLLTAAAMQKTIVQQYPEVASWLTIKVILVPL